MLRLIEILLRYLDRIVRPIATPGLPFLLVAVQAICWIGCQFDPNLTGRLVLIWDDVFAGEFWRLFTFALIAPAGHPLFAIFYFYILYMMGNFLEQAWGSVRFCSFIYLGLLLNALAGLAVPSAPISGMYMYSTIFLAFATLNPNFSFLIMFVLPVQVKYLAWLQVAGFLLMCLSGPWTVTLMILAALGNYLLFFANTLMNRGTSFHRQLSRKAMTARSRRPMHQCAVCGIDSETNRTMQFRYCSKCSNAAAYCEEHLRNHEHN